VKRVSFSLAVVLAACVLWAEEEHPVRVSLVGDGANRVGLHFVMEPGWHIYWKNPGESGLATEIEWSLPSGTRAGPLAWPAPQTFESPGGISSIGYSGEVLLMAEVDGSGGAVGTVAAAVSWLACKDVCLLGSSELASELPLASTSLRPKLFEFFEPRLPQSFSAESAPFGIRVDSSASAPRLWLSWQTQPVEVEVFVHARGKHQPKVRSATRGALTRVDLEPRGPLASEVEVLVASADGSSDKPIFTRLELVKNNAGEGAGTWRIQ